MELYQLRYFAKVYETDSYTKAAAQLYISRQALRHAIKCLENELGTILFSVNGRKLEPTLAAHTLFSGSRETLDAFSRLEVILPSIRLGVTEKIKCGQTNGIQDTYDIDGLDARRKSEHAAICIYITESSDHIKKLLANGELDIIHTLSPHLGSDNLYDYRCSKSGRLYLLMHKANPLAQKQSVCIDDLKGLPFITQGNEFDIHKFLALECKKKGFQLNVVFESPDYYTLAHQVNANLGITYYPMPKVEIHNVSNVVCIPFIEPEMKWYLQHMIRRDRIPGSSSAKFWEDYIEKYWPILPEWEIK